MNYLEALRFGNNFLKKNSNNDYLLDVELLLAYALKLTREKLLINLNKKIKKNNYNKYKKFLLRRKKMNQ